MAEVNVNTCLIIILVKDHWFNRFCHTNNFDKY